MTLELLLWIIFWVFVSIFLIVLLVIVYFYGKRSTRNNPDSAWVFIKTGLNLSKPIKAKKDVTTNKGTMFIYKGGVIAIPTTYKEYYLVGRRVIFVNHKGQLIATPLIDDVELSSSEKEDLIYELVTSKIGEEGIKAVRGTNKTNIIIVAVIAFIVGIIAVVGYMAIQNSVTLPDVPTNNQPAPEDNSQNIPFEEVK